MSKECRACKVSKPLEEFYIESRSKDGRQPYCKVCHLAKTKDWQLRNPDRYYATHLRRRYGKTEQAIEGLLKRQRGVCAICGRLPSGKPWDKRFHVDHDHATNEVRGLLCRDCNQGLGKFFESPDLLRRAADYLIISGLR